MCLLRENYCINIIKMFWPKRYGCNVCLPYMVYIIYKIRDHPIITIRIIKTTVKINVHALLYRIVCSFVKATNLKWVSRLSAQHSRVRTKISSVHFRLCKLISASNRKIYNVTLPMCIIIISTHMYFCILHYTLVSFFFFSTLHIRCV